MISVADPEGSFIKRAEKADLCEVKQGHSQYEQWRQHREWSWVLLCIKVRQYGHDREQVAYKMAAGVAEEGAGVRKIPREKSCECAAHQKTCDGNEIFTA